MKRKPTLSLVIPFRDRHEQVEGLLKSILKSTSENLEVVLADNSRVSPLAYHISDPRVRYFRTTGSLPMSENWSFGLNRCRGEYITVLGADEAVLPVELDGFIRTLQGARALFFYAPPIYFEWPHLRLPIGAVLARFRQSFPSQIYDVSLAHLVELHEKAQLPNFYARGAVHRDLIFSAGVELSIPSNAPDFFLSLIATLRLEGKQLKTTSYFPYLVGTSSNSTGLRWGEKASSEWLDSEIGPGHGDLKSDFKKAYLEASRLFQLENVLQREQPVYSSGTEAKQQSIQNQRRGMIAVIPVPPGVGNHGASVVSQFTINMLRKLRLVENLR